MALQQYNRQVFWLRSQHFIFPSRFIPVVILNKAPSLQRRVRAGFSPAFLFTRWNVYFIWHLFLYSFDAEKSITQERIQNNTFRQIADYCFNITQNKKDCRTNPQSFFSSPSWARTNNPTVNSRVLYHWAIEDYLLFQILTVPSKLHIWYYWSEDPPDLLSDATLTQNQLLVKPSPY